MEKNKNDRRIRFTRGVIRQSFLDILEEKPLGKITVKEICEMADINRTTFYAHYQDVYQLLESIEEEFYRDVEEYAADIRKGDELEIVPFKILVKIRENAGLCKVMFGKNGDKEFMKKLMYFAREDSLKAWRRIYPDIEESNLDWLYEFIVNGCAGIIQKWSQSDFNARPEEVSKFMARMYQNSVKALK